MVLLKKTNCKTKITEIEGKIPIISSLAANVALTAVENKIPNISSLVKKKKQQQQKKMILQKSLKLKRNVTIIIMINILQLQVLIL